MKKLILLTAVASLALVSCKKDRKCHCRTTTDQFDNAGVKQSTDITETDYVMTKTKRSTAFNECIHTKSSTTYTWGRQDTDDYCELK
jgi:hypothetical protein